MFKHSIPSFLIRLFPSLTWKVKTNDKKLYLTFDDGPHPVITPWVMDTLEQYNGKGTFFCVGGNVEKFSDTFRAIGRRGHAAGNHTYNHLNGWKTEDRDYFENIERAAQLIQGNLFRPPYGRIRLSQLRRLKNRYRIIMWNVLTCDYEKDLDKEKALDECIRLTRNGSIIVFHDSPKSEENLRFILPRYMAYFSGKGFTFESL